MPGGALCVAWDLGPPLGVCVSGHRRGLGRVVGPIQPFSEPDGPHDRVLLCIFFYSFVVSIKNLDLDSEYVNVGLINRRFTSKNQQGAFEFLEGREAGLSTTPA